MFRLKTLKLEDEQVSSMITEINTIGVKVLNYIQLRPNVNEDEDEVNYTIDEFVASFIELENYIRDFYDDTLGRYLPIYKDIVDYFKNVEAFVKKYNIDEFKDDDIEQCIIYWEQNKESMFKFLNKLRKLLDIVIKGIENPVDEYNNVLSFIDEINKEAPNFEAIVEALIMNFSKVKDVKFYITNLTTPLLPDRLRLMSRTETIFPKRRVRAARTQMQPKRKAVQKEYNRLMSN
jgi:hypothetical protein